MISKIAWIPRGSAAEKPLRFEPEYEDNLNIQNFQSNENDNEQKNELLQEDIEENYEGYDLINPSMEMVQNDLGVNFEEMNIEDDEDIDDMTIKNTDFMLCVANTDEEWSSVQVYVYDTQGALYIHHDISLPSFPLSLAWMDFVPSNYDRSNSNLIGNFVAIGTFNPEIEIWNLDIVDPLEPTLFLQGHQDAVMCLGWNRMHRQVLCSGSGDHTVKLWDMSNATAVNTYSHHNDKVVDVAWNPEEANILATGSYDKTVSILDCNTSNNNQGLSFNINADIESLCWNPFQPFYVVVSSEDGTVSCFDIRKNVNESIFQKNISDKPVTSVSFSPFIPGYMATSGVDQTVKLWDIGPQCTNEPILLGEKNMGIGKLMTMQFSVDDPYLLSAGGTKGILALWDTSENLSISERFNSRIVEKNHTTIVNEEDINIEMDNNKIQHDNIQNNNNEQKNTSNKPKKNKKKNKNKKVKKRKKKK